MGTLRLALAIVLLLTGESVAQVRSIDGTDNNPWHPEWGAAGAELVRIAPADYADGASEPHTDDLPGARDVSNAVAAQDASIPNAAGVSDMVWQWGQFVDHDIDLTEAADPEEAFDIPVPAGDAWFDPWGHGDVVIPLSRSVHDGGAPRQQLNQITAWIDGSMVYGSDAARARELRGWRGRLRTSPGRLLPFNVHGFPNAPTEHDPSFFLAGDVRANEQVGLTAMHTLFVREHNTIARWLRRLGMRSESVYQIARMLVIAEIQAITVREFLPALLGPEPLGPYRGWSPWVSPNVANSFSTAAYRFGHSMLSNELLRLDRKGDPIGAGPLPLAQAFFNPDAIRDHGIEPILRGLAAQKAQEIDTKLVDGVRNFLFGPPGAGGFDLASLNIQRGRDHGIPRYNAVREAYGLPKATTWSDVTSDPALQAKLASVYDHVDDVDAWVGGLAEDHAPGAIVGPLVKAVVADQFARLRDGDRFWYERALSSPLVRWVEHQTLARIVRRNTTIGREFPDDPFRVH